MVQETFSPCAVTFLLPLSEWPLRELIRAYPSWRAALLFFKIWGLYCFLFGLEVLLLLWYLFRCFYCFKGCHQGERYASKRSSSQCNADQSFWILGCIIMEDVLHDCLLLQILLKLSLPFHNNNMKVSV